ncbi:hypothetical protein OKW22_001012 [Bacilli bacterium PM5-3]|nr:hypothetical protein [Bacilli bacterium PM5-3]
MRKKLKKSIAVVSALVMALVMSLAATEKIDAATGVGHIKTKTTEITQRGSDVFVEYEFSVDEDNGPLTEVYAIYTWDPALMTFDAKGSIRDQVDFYNETASSVHTQMSLSNLTESKIGVKLKFTNVLPVGRTETVAPVRVEFKKLPVSSIYSKGEVAFSGNDWQYLRPDQLQWTSEYSSAELKLPLSVSVSPKTVDVVKGNDTTLTAEVKNSEGTTDTTGVTWSVSGATSVDTKVDATGKLSVGADETAKTLTVTATSKKDTTKSASAVVTVKDKPGLTLALTPATKKVFKKEATTVQYTATPTTTAAGTSVTYAISGNTEAGTTIDGNGLLTVDANENSSEITITATATNASTNPTTASATAKLSLVEIDVIVNPLTATVAKGYEQKFTATVQNDLNKDGVTWAVSGATSADTKVDANGKLVIGIDETATTLNVTATSKKDTTKSATSVVTVVEKAITINIAVSKSVVKPGTKVDVTSIMENDLKSNGVEWEISGQKTDGTTLETKVGSSAIKSTHKTVLNVGAKEKDGTTIIVKVTSVSDSTKSASAKVVVKNEAKPTPPKPEPKPEPKPTPGTGNDTNLVLLVSMFALSIVGGSVLLRNRFRNNIK